MRRPLMRDGAWLRRTVERDPALLRQLAGVGAGSTGNGPASFHSGETILAGLIETVIDRAQGAGRLFGLRLDGLWLHVGTPDAIRLAEAKIDQSVR